MAPALLVFVFLSLPATPGPALRFDDVLGSVEESPRVAAATAALATKRALDHQLSRATANPSLSFQGGYRLLQRTARGPEFLIELTQPANLSGHSSARRDAVAAEERVLATAVDARRLERRLAAAQAWLELWAAERVHAAAAEEVQIARALRDSTERLVVAGSLTRADRAAADAYLAEAELAELGAEGERFERGLDVLAALARDDQAPASTAGPLPSPELPPRETWAALVASVGSLPSVQLAALHARVEKARAIEERAARGTSAQFGLVVQRDSPGGLVLSGMARVTPALFERGERERGVVAAEADRLAGEAILSQRTARVDLQRALHEVEHTASVVEGLERGLVPASRSTAELRRRIFLQGEATLLEVLTTERAAVAAQTRLERSRAAATWARIKLWLLFRAMQPGATP